MPGFLARLWIALRSTPGWVTVALILWATQAANAQARWGLGRWQGEGTFFLDYEKQDNKSLQMKYETILFQERIGLRNVGAFILDPRFLTLNLGGSFGGSQEDALVTSTTPLRVGNGTLYDYDFDGLFLADQPYPVHLFATRTESVLTQGFGGRSDTSVESRGGTFEMRDNNFLQDRGFLNFTSFLDVHQEVLKEDSSVFGTPFKRDETRNVVSYHATKGGENSDADLRYEFNDVNDPDNPTDVFDSHTLYATHSLDFGPTLNRRLDSVFYYFDRTGAQPGSYTSFDEGLHVDHDTNLATNYRYDFSRSDSQPGATTTNAASFSLLDNLYRTLLSTVDVRGMRQDFPTGNRTTYGGQGGLDYRRSLPWSGQVFAATYVGYQIDDNSFSSSRIDVVDEPHTAPPGPFGFGAGFDLNNPFVLTDTIVMVDVQGGSRLPTVLNVDYELVPDGSLTKIVPLPGSPVIHPNDALQVSYSYNVDSSLKYSTTTFDARTGVEFPWVIAAYEHALSDQSRLSGTPSPQFLIDQNLDRFKLELRHDWGHLRAQSGAAYEILRSTLIDSNTVRTDQVLAYQPRPDLIAQINGDQYFVDYPGQNRHTTSYLVRGTIDWFAPVGATVSVFSGYRSYHDTAVPSDQIIDIGVRARWAYHNFEISPAFTWTDYHNRLTDIHGELRLTRHLF